MPQFEKGPIQISPRQQQVPLTVPRRDPVKSSEKAPTMKALMALPESERTMRVRVPLMTKVAKVKFDPIFLNTVEFKPGVVYKLHPIVAAELLRAIDNYEQVPMRQMTGNVEENSMALADVLARQQFEAEEQAARLQEAIQDAHVNA